MTNVGQTEAGVDAPQDLSDEDIQLLSLDDMRGAYKDMHDAKLSLNEKASVEGVLTKLQIVEQQLDMTHEQLRKLIGLYQTLQGQFDQYQEQRVRELNIKVNGGSTTREDMDGNLN